MSRKEKIETMLMLVNCGIYHVNDVSIFADGFEIINDGLLQFYIYVNAFDSRLKCTIAVIPFCDIRSIEGFTV